MSGAPYDYKRMYQCIKCELWFKPNDCIVATSDIEKFNIERMKEGKQ